jgi:nucleotide-binding universal stress UspA family protein
MRIVVAIDERLDETPLERVPELLNVHDATVLLVHVLDTAGREEWERSAGHHLLRPGAPRAGSVRMQAADRAHGERVLVAAAQVAAGWGAVVTTRLLEGSPKHEVRALLDAEGADVLVVFVRGHDVGPKSIHKEARFLIDHAPCAVLTVKG